MLLDFYKLREQPFGVTPDPRFLYFTRGHREALASLFYGIETGRGFLALIAEPGMGKTTLLFQLLERLKDSVRHAFLFQTQCDSRDLLRYLLDGLGLDTCDGDFVRMHAKLNEFLFRQAQAGRRVVLLIDEAQNLSDSVLETVRLLSDFEATDRKLLQIVLAGQPELAHRLLRPSMGQLRQRIAVLSHLRPLPPGEIIPYIHHRLRVAGYDGPGLFAPDALALIVELGHGVPRIINNICFSAMSLGCASGCRKIGAEIVQEAVADLSLDSYVQRPVAATAQPVTSVPHRSHQEKQRQTASVAASAQPVRFVRPLTPITPPFLAILRNSFAHIRDFRSGKATKRWLARAGSFIVGLGILLLYLGEGGQGRTTGHATPGQAVRVEAIAAADSPAAIEPVEAQGDSDAPALTRSRADLFFTHVVRPNDTLSRLCRRAFGRYDAGVLAEIRELNWDLWNPDHIEVGQKIRLPRQPSSEPNAIPDKGNGDFRNRQ